MKIKTAELTGPALDWAVAKCEGVHWSANGYFVWKEEDKPDRYSIATPHYSTDWSQGGPIIEREKLSLEWDRLWGCWICPDKRNAVVNFMGITPLIAAMRCYVASKLGDEVDVPEELA